MLSFPLPTADTAPGSAGTTLTAVEKAWGFAPHLMRTFANSPAVVEGAWAMLGAFSRTSFSPAEQQLIALAVSVENNCRYCAAAHSLMGRGAGLSEADLDALRRQRPLADPRAEALRSFITALVRQRGAVPQSEVQAFLAAGFSSVQVLEAVLGVAVKTLMNYTDQLAAVELDSAFQARAWTPALKQAA